MEKKNEIKIFEDKKVRSLWDEENEKWFFSIVDIVGILTDSPNPRKYWSVLKTRLKAEGSELTTNCSQLKMQSADGKFYLTDVANTEQLFRLIQSIPSPRAEPFKLWLAQVAAERLDEMQDPELSIDRALEQYLNLGYSENWISILNTNKSFHLFDSCVGERMLTQNNHATNDHVGMVLLSNFSFPPGKMTTI
ncbi:MAG: Bro-N domain-containing protein [Bacteroidetes bacterium]|nr:Bro-N domain-containing protein [Bacteroidota bacterium]